MFLVARIALRAASYRVVKNRRWNSRLASGATPQHHSKYDARRRRRARPLMLVRCTRQTSTGSSGAAAIVQTARTSLHSVVNVVAPWVWAHSKRSYAGWHGAGESDHTSPVSRSER